MSRNNRQIRVDLSRQHLWLLEGERLLADYPVSTGAAGAGERLGSGCTPRGLHRIRIKVGAGCPENAVFVGRRYTGEIYSPELEALSPRRDWILTRILWLSGQERGRNRGGACDTLRRYIYIHGCPDSRPMGITASHGCIRMRNRDLIDLFDRVDAGTPVDIQERF